MAVEKIKILGAVFELPAKQHCQFGPLCRMSLSNWQRCLAGSSKTDPRILIFFNSLGCWILCEIRCYLFPPKSWLDNAFLGSVCNQEMNKQSTTMTQHTLDCVKSDVRTTTLVIYYYWFASKNKLLLAWWIQVTITIDLLIKSGHHNYCVVFQGLVKVS